jgi:hypothetical protein
LTGIKIPEDKVNEFIEISAFNIEARYPDLKRSFRKKCTAEYAGKQMVTIKGVIQWLREMEK